MECSDCQNSNCQLGFRSVCAFGFSLVVTGCSLTQRGNIIYSLSWSPEENPILVIQEEELELENSITESSDLAVPNENQLKIA